MIHPTILQNQIDHIFHFLKKTKNTDKVNLYIFFKNSDNVEIEITKDTQFKIESIVNETKTIHFTAYFIYKTEFKIYCESIDLNEVIAIQSF